MHLQSIVCHSAQYEIETYDGPSTLEIDMGVNFELWVPKEVINIMRL